MSDLSSWLPTCLLIVACHSKFSLSPTTMAPANVLKRKETELERKICIFDQTEPIIDRAILDQALASQVEEQARCARLRGEVAEEGGNMAHTRNAMDLSPQEFMKAWKKIGNGKENKDWNRMEWEVRSYISPFHSIFS